MTWKRHQEMLALRALDQRVDGYYESGDRRSMVVGRMPGPDAMELRSNDYLALAHHPKLLNVQSDSIRSRGHGLMMSGVYADASNLQRSLEKRFASFMGGEDCLLCQSGYDANAGLLQAIAAPEKPIYVDFRAHMSIWQGAKSGDALVRGFRHNDLSHLERLIKKDGPGIIVVDSVYSTLGTECPLLDAVDLAEQYGCILVVDESHSLGTHGPHGAGIVEQLGIADRVQFRTASLAKTFAGRGGIIIGSARHIEFLRFSSMPAIFSSAVLPHEIEAFEATLDIVAAGRDLRESLWKNTRYLRQGLAALGYPIGPGESQIVPLEAGPEPRTLSLRDALEERNIFGAVFCAPATPRNRSMVRLSINAGLTREQLDTVIEVCAQIKDQVDPASWPGARTAGTTGRSANTADKKAVKASTT